MNEPFARFFDGESGKRLDVTLHVDKGAETLRLTHPDLPHGSQYWPLRAVRALRDQARADQLVLSLFDDGALDSDLIKTARLTVDDPNLIMELRVRCPNLTRREYKREAGRKVAVRAVGAVAALALVLFVILPSMANTLAPLIPVEREVAYGHSVVRAMERTFGGDGDGGLICTDTEGLAALGAMETRLLEGTNTLYDLNVVVFDVDMVNAFAAPGGQIVIMRGLIDSAANPDEVAAVLAHEIGHVEARDVTRNALRAAGSAGILSMVLGDITGGAAVVVVAEQMMNSAYSRDAERKADAYAMEMMSNANVNVRAMSDFFDSLRELEGTGPDLPTYLRSHPETQARADAARQFAQGQFGTRPVISESQWADLQRVCR